MHINWQHKTSRAFALPTVLIASIVMLSILAVSVTATTAVRTALKNQYYAQLAQVAGEAGVAYAQACLADNGNIPTWTDAKPLTPATDCTGTQNIGPAVKALVVAGGGGGGATGGGGGGGGVQTSDFLPVTATSYPVVVGGGGIGGAAGAGHNGNKGDPSSFNNLTAEGGGYGGTHGSNAGGSGGSGGGAGMGTGGAAAAGGAGSQGNVGGNGFIDPSWNGNNAGGGGAGGAGGNAGNVPGTATGGAGISNSITGSAVYYAGGGGGGEVNATNAGAVGAGGTGGGGGATVDGPGTSGTSGLGGGGGGGSYNSAYYAGGNGGSGVVIISYPTASGMTATTTGAVSISSDGANTIYKFTSSGTFTVTNASSVSCPSDPRCSVAVNGTVRSTFSIPKPTVDANGRALTIANTGSVELIRSSNSAVWRTYKQPSVQSVVVPALCSGNATAARGWSAAVVATTQNALAAASSAQTITLANTDLNAGYMYFRKDFSIAQAGEYRVSTITSSPQDIGDVYIDGNSVVTSAGWTSNQPVTLTAGCHTMGVRLDNATIKSRPSAFTLALLPKFDTIPVLVSDTTWRVAAGDSQHFTDLNYFETPGTWENVATFGGWNGTNPRLTVRMNSQTADWPATSGDINAQWITTQIGSAQNTDPPTLAYAWFRPSGAPFNITATTNVRLSTYCDDECYVYIDGAVVMYSPWPSAMQTTNFTLQPGYHRIGVRLKNNPLGGNPAPGSNPAAILLSVINTGTGAVVVHSDTTWHSTISWLTDDANPYSYDSTFVTSPFFSQQ